MERIPGVKQMMSLCVFVILSTDFALVNGHLIETYPKNIIAGEGQNATILCKASSPLIYCRFEIPGLSSAIRLSENLHRTDAIYKYFGRGLNEGECGISIERVKPTDHGIVKCVLGFTKHEASAEINLTVAIPPFRPEIQANTASQFHIEQDLQVTCISRNGRPPAQLYWFLDEEQLFEGVSRPHIQETITSRNTTLYTVSLQLNRRLRASDDSKFLICRSIHPADQPQEDRLQLQVRYRPQPIQENRVYGLSLGTTALVNIAIAANPRPRVEWAVDGKRIREGNQIERYEAYEPIYLGNGTYNITLAIAGLTIEDTTKTYHLKAANEFGQQDYSVEIRSKPPAPSDMNSLDTPLVIL